MNPKFKLPKVPPLARTLKRLRLGAELDEWWKNVSEEEWATLQRPQQAPPEAQPVKEKTPPKDDTVPELPKVSKDTRSREGRHQVRPRQTARVRKNKIRCVKPAAARAQNMVVARAMLGRVIRSGKPQSPNVVHVKIMILILLSGAKHTWLQATV